MKWILFFIVVSTEGDHLSRVGTYSKMDDCFRAWSAADQSLPHPKLNVQIICINVDDQSYLSGPS